ncbi:hypothetical protein HHI36_004872 [Cryptolaemus montrouzieri]|uniref:Uncharacterized protein n=1 Tax=Cryptolaemus montrouzieri TaxID=559131 RepID=A0ABD2NTF2_9CUCU
MNRCLKKTYEKLKQVLISKLRGKNESTLCLVNNWGFYKRLVEFLEVVEGRYWINRIFECPLKVIRCAEQLKLTVVKKFGLWAPIGTVETLTTFNRTGPIPSSSPNMYFVEKT